MFTKMLATLTLILTLSTTTLYAQQDKEGAAGGFDMDALFGGITGGAETTGDGTGADGGADKTGDGTTADGGTDKTGDGTTADGGTDKTGDGTTADGGTDKTGDGTTADGGTDKTGDGTTADGGTDKTGDGTTADGGTDKTGDGTTADGGTDKTGDGTTADGGTDKTGDGTTADGGAGKTGGMKDKEDAAIGGESDGSTKTTTPLGGSGTTATTLLGGLLGGTTGPKAKTPTAPAAAPAAAPAPQIIYRTVPGGTTTRIEKTIVEKPSKKSGNNWWAPALAGVAGLVGGIAIGSSTKKSGKSGVCKYNRYAIVGKDAQGENIYDCNRQGTWYINQTDGLFYPLNSRSAPAARAAPANRNQRYSKDKRGYYPDPKGKYLMNSKGKYYLPRSKKK